MRAWNSLLNQSHFFQHSAQVVGQTIVNCFQNAKKSMGLETHQFFLQVEKESGFQNFQNSCSGLKQTFREMKQKIEQGGVDPQQLKKTLLDHQKLLQKSLFSSFYYHQQLTQLSKKLEENQQIPNVFVDVLGAVNANLIEELKKAPLLSKQYFYDDLINYVIQFSGNQVTAKELQNLLDYYSKLVDVNLHQEIQLLITEWMHQADAVHQAQKDDIYLHLPDSIMQSVLQKLNEVFKIFDEYNSDHLIQQESQPIRYNKTIERSSPSIFSMATLAVLGYLYYYTSDTNRDYFYSSENYFQTSLTQASCFFTSMAASYGTNSLIGQATFAPQLALWISLSTLSQPVYADANVADSMMKRMPSGNELLLNTNTTGSQISVALNGIDDGRFLSTWRNAQSGSNLIVAQFLSGLGDKQDNEFEVNSLRFSSDKSSILLMPDSHLIVAWQNSGELGQCTEIKAKIFDLNGVTVVNEFRVNTFITNCQSNPRMTRLTNTSFIVVWDSWPQDNLTRNIYGQRYFTNGATIGGEFRLNSYISRDQYTPAVTTLANGDFWSVWSSIAQDSDGSTGVYGQRFNVNAQTIGSVFRVHTTIPDHQVFPDIATLENNNVVVVWQSGVTEPNANHGVLGQIFGSNGIKVGSEFQINSFSSMNQRVPVVTAISNNRFAVAWESENQDGDGKGIFAKLYNNDGTEITSPHSGLNTAVGNEFQVNSYITSHQHIPAISSLASGGFVVGWQSQGQDGDGYGVFAKIYNAIGEEVNIGSSTSGMTISGGTTGALSTSGIGTGSTTGGIVTTVSPTTGNLLTSTTGGSTSNTVVTTTGIAGTSPNTSPDSNTKKGSNSTFTIFLGVVFVSVGALVCVCCTCFFGACLLYFTRSKQKKNIIDVKLVSAISEENDNEEEQEMEEKNGSEGKKEREDDQVDDQSKGKQNNNNQEDAITLTLLPKRSEVKSLSVTKGVVTDKTHNWNPDQNNINFKEFHPTDINLRIFENTEKDQSHDFPIRAGMKRNSARVLIWDSKSRRDGHIGMILRDSIGKYRHISLYRDTDTPNSSSLIEKILCCGCCNCCISPGVNVESYYQNASKKIENKKKKNEEKKDPNSDLGQIKDGKDASYFIDIYNLKVDDMIEFYDDDMLGKNGRLTWRLFGDTCVSSKYQNCSSLCYELLKKGGILGKLESWPIRYDYHSNNQQASDMKQKIKSWFNEGFSLVPTYRQKPWLRRSLRYGVNPLLTTITIFLVFFIILYYANRNLCKDECQEFVKNYNKKTKNSIELDCEAKCEKDDDYFKEAFNTAIIVSVVLGFFILCASSLKTRIQTTLYNNEPITSPFKLSKWLVNLAYDHNVEDVHMVMSENAIKNLVVVQDGREELGLNDKLYECK